jgi:hypothetical protein
MSLFDTELQNLINASAKIFPHPYTDITGNLNPDNHEYAIITTEGEHKNEIYKWNSTSSAWELIGADDRSIDWTDVKNKPTEFNPTSHNHNDLYYTEAEINSLLSGKADLSHTHSELHTHSNMSILDIVTYTGALQSIDLIEIENLQSNKADTIHTHTEADITDLQNYALVGHIHDGRYYTESEINSMLSGKANIFTNRAVLDKITEQLVYESYDLSMLHDHEERLWNIENGYTEGHSHANLDALNLLVYSGALQSIDLIEIENNATAISGKADIGHTHTEADITDLKNYALASHNHDLTYAALSHTHTESEITDLGNYALASHNHDSVYSAINHNHDGRYYTESEITSLLSGKADTGHTHNYMQYGFKGDVDLNTVVDSGVYRIDDGLTNAPSGVAWGQLLVMHGSSDTVVQIVADHQSQDIYWRGGNPPEVGGSGSWNAWREFWHTGNFDPSTKADVGHTHSYAPLSPSYHYVKAGDEETKFRLWGTSNYYGVGMVSGVTYGYLGDYAMTFCMNNDSDRGWWWGYQGQSKSDGAMSLTTDGRLKLKDRLSFGGHSGDDRYIRGEGEYLRIQTPYGFISIGAGNTSYSHFFTDRPSFYFNRAVAVDGDIKYYKYNNSEYLANVSKNVTHDVLHNNTTLKSGFYTTAEGLYNANNTAQIEGNWWHIINMHHHNNDGHNAQIAVGLSGGKERIYTRWSSGGAWTEWDKVPVGNCGKITISSSAPISPQINDIWIDTSA